MLSPHRRARLDVQPLFAMTGGEGDEDAVD